METIEIPKQLQNANFRFVLLKSKSKIPFEKNWTEKGYSYTDEKFMNHLKEGNYGVVTGFGDIAVIDIDVPEYQKKVVEFLPETFSVKTGGGGFHNYFRILELNKKIIMYDKQNQHIGEVQSWGAQVVGPNSIHPTGTKYIVDRDVEIATIKMEDLKIFLKKIGAKDPDEELKSDIEEFPEEERSPVEKLDIMKIWDAKGLKKKGDEYYGPHPVHGSKNGLNFFINPKKNAWHCFRCNSGGGVLSAIAVKEGLILCQDAKKGKIGIEIAEKALEIARKKYGLKDYIATDLEDFEGDAFIAQLKKIKNTHFAVILKNMDKFLKDILKHDFNDAQIDYLLGTFAMKTKMKKATLISKLDEHRFFDESSNGMELQDIFDEGLKVPEFLIEPIVPKGALVLLGGKPASYKSFTALNIACSLKTGAPLFDKFKPVGEEPKVILYDLENRDITPMRLKYILNSFDCKKRIQNFKILEQFNKKSINKELERCMNYDLIILDSYVRFIQGEENKSEVTNMFYQEFIKPMLDLGKTVVVIMHFKKGLIENLEEATLMDLFRGSGDLIAQCDLALAIIKSSERIDVDSGNLSFNVSIAKAKNRLGLEFDNFSLAITRDNKNMVTKTIFNGFGDISSPKKKVMVSILAILEDGMMSSADLIDKVTEKDGVSKVSVQKYLKELQMSGDIFRPKYGHYALNN